jgi:hypothetical protein
MASQSAELKKLKADNQRLLSENERLKKSPGYSSHRWKKIFAGILAGLAVILLMLGNIFFWAGNTIVNTDRYISTVQPIYQDPTVQAAIADYTTNQLFKQVDVQSVVQQALPPRADFLAPAIDTQVKGLTESSLKKILASPKVQSAWIDTQRHAHDRLINLAANYKGDGTIDINDFYQQLSKQLGDTKLSFLANKQLPPKIGTIKVVDAPFLPTFHRVVTKIGLWQFLATALLIAFSAMAIWLSSRRRRMVVVLGLFFAFGMFVTLVVLRVAPSAVAGHIAAPYQAAAKQATKLALNPLRTQTITLFLASLLLSTVAWLSGQSRSAKLVKSRLQTALDGKLHQSIFGNKENRLTLWFGRHKKLLQWLTVALVALLMLIVQLSPAAIIWFAAILVLLEAFIELLAAQTDKL